MDARCSTRDSVPPRLVALYLNADNEGASKTKVREELHALATSNSKEGSICSTSANQDETSALSDLGLLHSLPPQPPPPPNLKELGRCRNAHCCFFSALDFERKHPTKHEGALFSINPHTTGHVRRTP